MVQTVMENEIKEYTVTIYTENQIGLLAQITNVFTRHGLSIWSLSAGATASQITCIRRAPPPILVRGWTSPRTPDAPTGN